MKHIPKSEKVSYQAIQKALEKWYMAHHRSLPWRYDASPYHIWISEIILQQTRVAQGLDYYKRITAAFPTVEDLARAQEDEVLRLWQGLGYYTRARNLHACAKKIVAEYKGIFPKTYKELLTLPGIGPYTAGAIASIAFGENVAVVDGNVYRVLARLFGIAKDITLSATQKEFKAVAMQLLPKQKAGLHNQALMEFGALVCTPRSPACESCVLQRFCLAYRDQTQAKLPVKGQRIKVKKRYFHYFIIEGEGKIFFKKRKTKDIWHGLYEFHLVEKKRVRKAEKLDDHLVQKMVSLGLTFHGESLIHQHQLTHQRLHLVFFHVKANKALLDHLVEKEEEYGLKGVNIEEVDTLPLPIVLANFVAAKGGFSMPYM